MASGKGRTPAVRDLGDKRIEMLHGQRKRADISGKGRTPDGQRKRARTRPEAFSLGDNEKKWETNERKWETSQPGTRPQAWETNGDKPAANPTTSAQPGRQMKEVGDKPAGNPTTSAQPGRQMKRTGRQMTNRKKWETNKKRTWETSHPARTNEKKWETNERKWETSQPGTRPQAPSLGDK